MLSSSSHSPDTAQAELAENFKQAIAAANAPVQSSDFLMAGRLVRIRTVGTALHDAMTRAFVHLRCTGGPHDGGLRPCDLTIDLWDAEETGVGDAHNAADYDPQAPGETQVSPDGRYISFGRPQLHTVLDRVNSHIVGCVGSASRLTLYDLGRPLYSELLLWHHDHGLLAVHAGLVSHQGQGVLLAGPGGSGKSTTSVLCHLAGFAYLADDYVAVEWKKNGGLEGHSIFNSTHFEPKHLERLPALASQAVGGTLTREDKSLVMLSALNGGAFANSAPLRVLALPRVAHTPRTTVRPATKVEALLRLAPSSLFLMPYAGMGRVDFERLHDLVNRVPAYWLELGEDLQEIPDVVLRLLQESVAS